MATYRIANTISGVVMGDYQGATEAEALDAMARDMGGKNYAEIQEISPAEDGEILVKKVFSFPDAVALLSAEMTGRHVARHLLGLDDDEESDVEHRWMAADELIAWLEGEDEKLSWDIVLDISTISANDAEALCAAAERVEPIGYEVMPTGTRWRILTITRDSDYCDDLHVEYVWPVGGF